MQKFRVPLGSPLEGQLGIVAFSLPYQYGSLNKQR